MTPEDTEQANAALLFELDEKIEERIRQAIGRALGMSALSTKHSHGLLLDVTYSIGRELLSNNGFLEALSEEITKRVYSKFNPSMPMYNPRSNTF
jgi:VIT1/CCC1 family predicted Fe2+/Mn2+ transporter